MALRGSSLALLSSTFFVLAIGEVSAQLSLRGRVVDAAQRSPIPGATVVVQTLPDTTRRWGAVTNPQGEFQLSLPGGGRYRLRVHSVGYRALERVLVVQESQDLGVLSLEVAAVQAEEVTVEATQERARVKGDTVEYAASAYKVNPDATAEDLVRKLPGVTSQGGQLQAFGETVRRVLVDGREFFGQDPTAVLRNLPAEVVQSVQIFDRESDQARLTGVRDPSSAERTLNIITNPALRTGRFGRVYGGYGSDSRYQAGATLNFFRDTLRFSVVGMTNNINQQNFALDDVLGIVNFAGQQSSGGPPPSVLRMMFAGGRFPGPPGGGQRGGPRGPFAQLGTFFVPEQDGINTAHSIGGMYSNRWGSWLDVTGSYLFNALLNTSDATLHRSYFGVDSLGSSYAERSYSEGELGTHRLNVRAELSPDTATTVLLSPRLTFQPTESRPTMWGALLGAHGDTVSHLTAASSTTNRMLQGSTQLLVVRRFAPNRSFSVELEGDYTPQQRRTQQTISLSLQRASSEDSTVTQLVTRRQSSSALSITATYTEPLDSLTVLQFRYAPAWDWGQLRQEAWGTDTAGVLQSPLLPLASDLLRQVVEHRAGVAYMYQGRVFQWTARLEHSWQRLQTEEQLQAPRSESRSFRFWLPFFMLEYRPTRMQNLRLVYRSFVTTPSPAQLGTAVDNSTPTALATGNPSLRPSYTHTLFARYSATDPFGGRLFFGILHLSYAVDYIGSETTIVQQDTTIAGVPLPRGGQYTVPVNLSGYWSGRTFWVFGLPAPWLRSTLSLTASVDFSRTPSRVNSVLVRTDWVAPSAGVTVSSNWSERVDFSVAYYLTLSRVLTTAPSGSSRYLQHAFSADVTLMPGPWVLSSQFRVRAYSGLGDELGKPVVLWNLGVGYRFLKNNAAEVRLVVADVLNQNRGISRTVTGQYVEDSSTRVLGRYAMLQLSYRLRNFSL